MRLRYNDKTGNFEEEFTSNNFLSIETDSAYSKEQALQVWDNISKKVEWLPFKCYCAFGGFSAILTLLWFFNEGLYNLLNLFFLCSISFSITGFVAAMIGFLLKGHIFRSKVRKYIEEHPSSGCVTSLKKMLDHSEI